MQLIWRISACLTSQCHRSRQVIGTDFRLQQLLGLYLLGGWRVEREYYSIARPRRKAKLNTPREPSPAFIGAVFQLAAVAQY